MVKRIVVGAHYGLRDWLAQRISGVLIAVYVFAILVALPGGRPLTYAAWRGFFEQGWVRVSTLVFAASLAWHMWVGIRDILMDYVQPVGLRLALHTVVLLTILAYLAWAIHILWR
ncbi:MAG: succinate dehydrogenase, hydrophobic membrane anchor protein [Betaproteobacteria bacterium]|nr:succinate dehydrogenase, hydrophobic membrane anchor protein [Betaproteobacteria bacterium]